MGKASRKRSATSTRSKGLLKAGETKKYKHMTLDEVAVAQKLHAEGAGLGKIAGLLKRGKGTISRHVFKKNKAKRPKGRPPKIIERVFVRLEKARAELVKKMDAQREVSVAMIKKRARVHACDKVVLNAFHDHDTWFFKLRERPVLSDEDVASRLVWANEHKKRSPKQWINSPHAIIDNKNFQVYGNRAGREHAARRTVRGVYRPQAAAPHRSIVRPKKTLKFPAKSMQVTAAVIKGRIRLWHYVPGRWNAEAAAKMYSGPLLKTMQKAFPSKARSGKATWHVLEDNDPSGYKSRKAVAAKKAAGIVTDDLPPRSPDLNVLDYSLWHEINVRMRAQEQQFSKAKVESSDEYLGRLRRTALLLPSSLVQRCVGDMARRVRMVVSAKGGLFNE